MKRFHLQPVVRKEPPGPGLNGQLVASAEAQACRRGAGHLYLLSADAGDYSAARGCRTLQGTEAPPGIKLHPQFRSLRPSASIFTTKALGREIGEP